MRLVGPGPTNSSEGTQGSYLHLLRSAGLRRNDPTATSKAEMNGRGHVLMKLSLQKTGVAC